VRTNDDEILIEDTLDFKNGIHRLHVMGLHPFEEDGRAERWLASRPVFDHGTSLIRCEKSKDEAGLHHLKVEWRAREACRLVFADSKDLACRLGERELVLWAIGPGEKVQQALLEAGMAYEARFGAWPPYAWIRSLPKGAKWGSDVDLSKGSDEPGFLFSAYWVPAGFVAVGR
jgi:hypothetical protein